MKNTLPMLVLPLLAACSSWNYSVDSMMDRLTPYKLEVPQGNAISQEKLAKLKPGMTPSQVRYLLGAPLLVEPFRPDRWDYVSNVERGGKVLERRRITLVFEQDKLKTVEGDVVTSDEPIKAESILR